MDSEIIYTPLNTCYYGIYDTAQPQTLCTFNDEAYTESDLHLVNGTSSVLLPSVQRYLDETDRPLFMPSIPEIDAQAMATLPNVPMQHFQSARGSDRDWAYPDRLTSPTNSTLDSSYVSSEWSGRQQSPLPSPYINGRPHSPQHDYCGGVAYAYGGHPPVERKDSHSPDACVALHDVQRCADDLPETTTFSTEPLVYSAYGYAQEGYQPIQSGDETTPADSYSTPGTEYPCEDEVRYGVTEVETPRTPEEEPDSPVIRRRRPQAVRLSSTNAQVSSGRVGKRSNASRRASHRSNADEDQPIVAAANRAFPCPLAVYGCTSTFGSKNEWKRHVSTQHMRLGYWRCDQCSCTTGERNKPNDFNRKDLFVQHVRRMHPVNPSTASSNNKKSKPRKEHSEEKLMQDAATRCYRHLRTAPEKSQCLFCEQRFHGKGSWDERMEHIGRHMENAKKDSENTTDPSKWRVDDEAANWFLKAQVIVIEEGQLVLSA